MLVQFCDNLINVEKVGNLPINWLYNRYYVLLHVSTDDEVIFLTKENFSDFSDFHVTKIFLMFKCELHVFIGGINGR